MMAKELTKTQKIKKMRDDTGISLRTASMIIEKNELRERIEVINLNDHDAMKQLLLDIVDKLKF